MNELVDKIKEAIDDNCWFDIIDVDSLNLEQLTKEELIEIIRSLNKKMEESADWWDG